MKSEKRQIKKQIKARIEVRKQTKMGVRDKYMITGGRPRPIAVDLVSRNEIRTGIKRKDPIRYEIKDYGDYVKPESVDYDALIYISSYDRYEKLEQILNQLFSQETKYTFKVIVMNDGSTDKRYQYLKNKFPEIIYLRNKVNGGKESYWKRVNSIFREVKKYETHEIGRAHV